MDKSLPEMLRAMGRGEHDDLSIGFEAADELARLTAEIERLRAALREIDKVAVAHVAGIVTDQQRIVRLERLVFDLAETIYRSTRGEDGTWGHPSHANELKRIQSELNPNK